MKLNNTSFINQKERERERERDRSLFPAVGRSLALLIGHFGPDTKQFVI